MRRSRRSAAAVTALLVCSACACKSDRTQSKVKDAAATDAGPTVEVAIDGVVEVELAHSSLAKPILLTSVAETTREQWLRVESRSAQNTQSIDNTAYREHIPVLYLHEGRPSLGWVFLNSGEEPTLALTRKPRLSIVDVATIDIQTTANPRDDDTLIKVAIGDAAPIEITAGQLNKIEKTTLALTSPPTGLPGKREDAESRAQQRKTRGYRVRDVLGLAVPLDEVKNVTFRLNDGPVKLIRDQLIADDGRSALIKRNQRGQNQLVLRDIRDKLGNKAGERFRGFFIIDVERLSPPTTAPRQ